MKIILLISSVFTCFMSLEQKTYWTNIRNNTTFEHILCPSNDFRAFSKVVGLDALAFVTFLSKQALHHFDCKALSSKQCALIGKWVIACEVDSTSHTWI